MSAPAPAPVADVNGIPLFLGPPVDGRWAGGLIFRVGTADETLASAGITHLTEHLALHFSDPTKVHSNGSTGTNVTHFHIGGTEAEVISFLNDVAASLRDLPLHRAATEKEVLRAEANRRGGPADGIHGWRHGARGYGLPSFNELGLHRITEDQIAAWAARWFTTGNAAVWLAADRVPQELDLTLPDGARMAPPPLDPWLPESPAHYIGPDGIVATTSHIPRSTAGHIYASVIQQALYRELRLVGGYSYSPTAGYDPIDAETALLYATADCLPEKQDAVVGAFVDTMAQLRLGEIPETDIAAAVENAREMIQHPDAGTMRLPAAATDHLLGHQSLSEAELLAELYAVDEATVRTVARQAHETALVQVPGRPLDWAGYAAAPEQNGETINGTLFAFLEDGEHAIVVGQAGIGAEHPAGNCAVPWGEVVAVARYPDGARTVVGRDGFQVHVEPTLLATVDGGTVTQAIDSRVSPEVAIDMPARDPERIPPRPAPLGKPARGHSVLRGVARVLAAGLLVLLALYTLGFVLALIAGDYDVGETIVGVILLGLGALGWRWLWRHGKASSS